MGGGSSKEEKEDDTSAKSEGEADNKVVPFTSDDEDEDKKASDTTKEGEVGAESEESAPSEDKEPSAKEGDRDETAGSRLKTETPVMGRPRPSLPVSRLALDDPNRPPRVLPFDAAPLPEWGDEVYEEARMIADFSKVEIEGLHRRFTAFDNDNVGYITGEEFSMQPEFDANPLRDLIMVALEVKDRDWMDFNTFVEKMSVFNIYGSVEEKMKFIYKMTDVNQDGKVDKGDFEVFLMLICGPELSDEEVVLIMEKTFAHVDTDDDLVIDYDEFTKIVGRTDVASKVSIVSF